MGGIKLTGERLAQVSSFTYVIKVSRYAIGK
jgi:hypothetical protein